MIEITADYLASQGLSLTLPKRFWNKVHKSDGCWLWLGYRDKGGYGTIRAKSTHEKMMAHAVSWLLNIGPIPKGKWVLHHCDNPPCVRPDHLFSGTAQDNTLDMFSKGRSGTVGELCWTAKLNPEKVEEIRNLYSTGMYSQLAIGKMFGVAEPTIQALIAGRSWRHKPHTKPE